MRRRKISWFAVLNTIFMLLVVVTMSYPFVHMAAVSLSSDLYVMKGEVNLWPKGFTTEVYQSVLQKSDIIIGYKNTIIYVTLGTALSLLCTSMGAYALSRKNMMWRKQLSFLIVFTMLFNGGMIPTYLVVKYFNLLNTMWAMILPTAISAYNFFVMRTFFGNIPVELEESAKVDGLNDLGVFWRIAMPLSKPALATIGLFYAVFIWNNFMSALIYLTDQDLFPLQMVLRNIVFQSAFAQDQGAGDVMGLTETVKYATILISTIPILCVYPFVQKHFVKGALLGSVKG